MNWSYLVAGLVLAIFLFFFVSSLAGGRISSTEAESLLREGKAVLVDVREPGEWAGGVATGAELLPLSDLMGSRKLWDECLKKNQGKIFLLYCASGMRSAGAAKQLQKEGCDARNAGSYGAWKRAGLPTRQP